MHGLIIYQADILHVKVAVVAFLGILPPSKIHEGEIDFWFQTVASVIGSPRIRSYAISKLRILVTNLPVVFA